MPDKPQDSMRSASLSRPRLLILGLNYAPEPVGVGKYTAEMAEWLAGDGLDVRVVTARPYYPWWRAAPRGQDWDWREDRLGVRVLRCPLHVPARPGGVRRMLHLASFAAASLPVLARQLTWRPHVVLGVAPTLASAPWALALARVSGAAAWLHVQDLELDLGSGMDFLAGRIGRACLRAALCAEQALLRRFDRVSAVSRGMLQALEGKGVRSERLEFVPNWADLELFRPDLRPQGRELFRQLLGIGPEQPLVLYAGSMGRKQDLDTVARAARLLWTEVERNRGRAPEQASPLFVLCGQGPELARLRDEHGSAPNLRFLPVQPEAAHAAMLAGADVHLLPQRAETEGLAMPSKLASILACGGPVVATAAADAELGRMVTQAGGLLVEHGDAHALARAVGLLLDGSVLRETARRAARQYALAHLDKQTILSGLRDSLTELAEVTDLRASRRARADAGPPLE